MLNNRVIADQKSRILLAEDTAINADLLKRFLKDFDVVHCWNGKEAFDEFLKGPFDAVITDNDMGGNDGLELLGKIRAIDVQKLVVVFSGNPEMKQKYLQAGANHFFEKTQFKALKDFIDSALFV